MWFRWILWAMVAIFGAGIVGTYVYHLLVKRHEPLDDRKRPNTGYTVWHEDD